jgi:cytochrome c553
MSKSSISSYRWLASLLARAALAALSLCAAATGAAPVVEDSIAQRVQACTGCHGAEGRAAADGYYPRIAGKPAGYLHNQLLNFRDGRRQYPLMSELLQPLSDDYLLEIARHFSALDLPYPAAARPAAPQTVLARGEQLVRKGDESIRVPACAGCHGDRLMGVAPSIPGLAGLPRDYVAAQLSGWKSGIRHAHAPDCMAQIAQRMAPDDINAVAHWLSVQAVPAGGKPARAPDRPLTIRCGGVPAAQMAPEGAR